MPQYARIIAMDVGSKWVGLARTDLLRTSANSMGTFHVEDVFDELKKIFETEQVQKVVVGWPLTPEGKEGRAVNMVRGFMKKFHSHFPEVEIAKMDERYTSKEAVASMAEAGVPKMKRRETERVNRAAAAVILQRYLEQEA